jgi:hypothetical protein
MFIVPAPSVETLWSMAADGTHSPSELNDGSIAQVLGPGQVPRCCVLAAAPGGAAARRRDILKDMHILPAHYRANA